MKFIISLAVLAGLAFGAFFTNEAYKEVKYLCGNFSAGVSDQVVLQQLDTGDFLRLTVYGAGQDRGTRIVVDSLLTLTMHRCVIELDKKGEVIEANSGFAIPY